MTVHFTNQSLHAARLCWSSSPVLHCKQLFSLEDCVSRDISGGVLCVFGGGGGGGGQPQDEGGEF